MTFRKTVSAAVASTALIFTGFTPAMAAPVSPVAASSAPLDTSAIAWSAENDKAQRWRGHRGYRGYRGYRGHRHRRHRGIDGGDVVAGILILGGIAAIASAASKNKKRDRRYEDRDYRNRDYRDRDYRNDDRRYDNRRSDDRSDERSSRGTGSMDQAINACSNAAEVQAGDNARVSEIRAVARDGAGWRVEGDLTGGKESTFLCGATGSRVDYVQLGSGNLAFAN